MAAGNVALDRPFDPAQASGSPKISGRRRRSRTNRPKAADQSLAGSQAQKSAPVLAFTVDQNYRSTDITPEGAAWCGGTVADFIGIDARDRCPTPPQLHQAIEAALTQGLESTLEYESLMVPGRWVEVGVAPVAGGARVRFQDISSRAAGKGSLDWSEDSWQPSLDSAPAGIVLLDRRGVIVATNAAWRARIAQIGLDQADSGVGARYAEVVKAAAPNTEETGFERRLMDFLVSGDPLFETTFSRRTPAGTTRRQVRITPVSLGGETYFVVMHEDLTERARVLTALLETSDQLLHAQEQERQRIAIELHDSTSQHLAGLTLSLGSLRRRVTDPAALALIEEMDKLAREAVQETRVLSYLLNASDRQTEGLEASARRFVEGFGRRTGLMATFEGQGRVHAISAAAKHAVFRVIQEALSNVYRHACADQVLVSLASGSGEFVLRVVDDGKGIGPAELEAAQAPLGVGIPGMRARIEQLGGRLEIKRGAPGTIVSASIPLGKTKPD
jgi:signal transduction histidine kinase